MVCCKACDWKLGDFIGSGESLDVKAFIGLRMLVCVCVRPVYALCAVLDTDDVVQFEWAKKIAESFLNQENEVRL